MIQKHELPILEYDFDSTEVIRPNHGAEELVLPEKCIFAFLGDTIDDYAFEVDAVPVEHFETITKTYPVYVVSGPAGCPCCGTVHGFPHLLRMPEDPLCRLLRRAGGTARERISRPCPGPAG